ncbi:GTP-binding protein [Nocardia albiluteola]|nr:GTP-binding protein [Nocardia albiluteola]
MSESGSHDTRADLEYRSTMGAEVIEPQSIRNVTIVGEPGETAGVLGRLRRRFGIAGYPAISWLTGREPHTIRIAELSSRAPGPDLERSIRLADGLIAVVPAAAPSTPRLETVLRVADDHQVARLCLVTGLDRPGADFDRAVRTIADTRGAAPLTLQIPLGLGAAGEGVADLLATGALGPLAAEIYGPHWQLAQQRYHALAAAVLERDDHHPATERPHEVPPAHLRRRIRDLTRLGDVVPVLCGTDLTPLLDAIVRYLPSPLDVCQPEHALDY